MPPKRPNRITSVFECWNKQQSLQQKSSGGKGFSTNDVITLGDTQEDLSMPSTSRGSNLLAMVNRNSSGMDSLSVLQHNELSEEELMAVGYNSEAARFIYFPTRQALRPYEVHALKKCLSMNTCISLPSACLSLRIFSLLFLNLMRWFPRSRFIFCCSSAAVLQLFQTDCISAGISGAEVVILNNFMEFKKKSKSAGDLGRILITTPQTVSKMAETDQSCCNDIACLAFYCEANEAMAKFKKIIGTFCQQSTPFRIVVSIPQINDHSKKISSITKRQQTITSLHISHWEEAPVNDLNFRRSFVPPGVLADYWHKKDMLTDTIELLQKWGAGILPHFTELCGILKIVPCSDVIETIYYDWDFLQKAARNVSPDCAIKSSICCFLAMSYRELLINGPRAFYLYCSDRLNNKSTPQQSEKLQLVILEDSNLSKVFSQVQARYSYSNATPFGPVFNNASVCSHIKYTMVRSIINRWKKGGVRFQGLIICGSFSSARVVFESIADINGIELILATPPDLEIDPANKRCRPINRLSGSFYQTCSVVLILSLDLIGVVDALDTAISNVMQFVVVSECTALCTVDGCFGEYIALLSEDYEKLRETDGRIVLASSEPDQQPRRFNGSSAGAVDRYTFKFEPSRMFFDVDKKIFTFVQPGSLFSVLSSLSQNVSGLVSGAATNLPPKSIVSRRQGFELTVSEFAEYSKRIDKENMPFVNKRKRKRFAVMGEDVDFSEDISEINGNLGDVPSSVLSNRLVSFSSTTPFVLKQRRCRYQFEDRSDRKRIAHYDMLIQKLNRLLSIS